MIDLKTRADLCAALSRADASGKDLCFINKDSAMEIYKTITPRILELSEIPEWQGAVWIEWKNVPDQFEAMLYRYEQRPFFRFSGQDHPFGIDLGPNGYGSEWRAWTLPASENERQWELWQI